MCWKQKDKILTQTHPDTFCQSNHRHNEHWANKLTALKWIQAWWLWVAEPPSCHGNLFLSAILNRASMLITRSIWKEPKCDKLQDKLSPSELRGISAALSYTFFMSMHGWRVISRNGWDNFSNKSNNISGLNGIMNWSLCISDQCPDFLGSLIEAIL